MSTVKEAVEVDVPVRTAYDQWTQFEEFPHFMEGVEEVRQVDDRHNHWTTRIGGVTREFDTEIVDQLPDERITWRTTSGDTRQRGSVRFERLDDDHTRVELVMDVEPSGAVEKAGDLLGVLDRRVKGDMRRFKSFVEERGAQSGAWRGRIRPGDVGGTAGPAGTGDATRGITPDPGTFT
ncbi:SRPBCC family protein [Streptomyces sp. NPDC006186]|uniref:SRPBCC family protein n=1 Tax=Streptomyces sp. NPDC006186 TaxID=3155248 RepID=UPI0033AA3194